MSHEKKRVYHHHNLREKLLETAAEMVAEGGVRSVTMRALAQRIGVSRSAPYRHFSDKAALLAAVAEEGYKNLRQFIRKTSQNEQQAPLMRLQNMGQAYVQFAIEHPTHYRLMFGEEAPNLEEYPTLCVVSDKTWEDLKMLVELCQQENTITPGDSYLLSYAIWAIWHGVASLIIDRQIYDNTEISQLIAMTFQVMLEGIKT
jgi:AcrR family transcriptional regulator